MAEDLRSKRPHSSPSRAMRGLSASPWRVNFRFHRRAGKSLQQEISIIMRIVHEMTRLGETGDLAGHSRHIQGLDASDHFLDNIWLFLIPP